MRYDLKYNFGRPGNPENLMAVFAAAARYSRALDIRARHDRRDGAVICGTMALGVLVIWSILAL